MTSLESKVLALLADAERLLEPIDPIGRKWVLVEESRQQSRAELRPSRNEKGALSYSCARALRSIEDLKSYADAKAAFEKDHVFSRTARAAGYWGTFEAVFQTLISSAGRMGRATVSINRAKAVADLKSLRDKFGRRQLRYEASVRLLGVDLRCRRLELPAQVTLHRLTRKERNARQPHLEPFLPFGRADSEMLSHATEARVSFTISVDNSQENAFFTAQNDAVRTATDIFTKVRDSMLVALGGNIQLGILNLTGGLVPYGGSVPKGPFVRPPVELGKRELKKLEALYELLPGGSNTDQVISRAIHRFVLGQQRTDLEDQLVDFVIAWEAILLTQKGEPAMQELSYRFAVNRAALLRASTRILPKEAYRKMRSAYSARSKVVHGGTEQERERALKAGDFANLNELCDFLKKNFRAVVFWLAAQRPNQRPYCKEGAWESLLWM